MTCTDENKYSLNDINTFNQKRGIEMNDEELVREAYKHFETALRAISSLEDVHLQATFDAPIDRMFERLLDYINQQGWFDYPVDLILQETVNDMETSLETHRRLMGQDIE